MLIVQSLSAATERGGAWRAWTARAHARIASHAANNLSPPSPIQWADGLESWRKGRGVPTSRRSAEDTGAVKRNLAWPCRTGGGGNTAAARGASNLRMTNLARACWNRSRRANIQRRMDAVLAALDSSSRQARLAKGY